MCYRRVHADMTIVLTGSSTPTIDSEAINFGEWPLCLLVLCYYAWVYYSREQLDKKRVICLSIIQQRR